MTGLIQAARQRPVRELVIHLSYTNTAEVIKDLRERYAGVGLIFDACGLHGGITVYTPNTTGGKGHFQEVPGDSWLFLHTWGVASIRAAEFCQRYEVVE